VSATPAPDDPALLIGRVIAERYRVEAVLGRGGMGAVLRCHHLGLHRDVAVKLLHPDIAADAEIATRFEREATSASRLDHPNCVRVLDFGAWQPAPGAPVAKYLAMQLLEGCELADLLGTPLAPARSIALVRQIFAGLEHAHGQGIVHRDLKPENVFVTRDHTGAETLKLVDFGIAKITDGEGANAKLTRMGLVFGTPQYMSPEQAAGGVVDARTDLYATGVILYEMIAGLPPFLADDAMALLRMHLFDAPPPLADSVPAPLRALVLRLLEKDRAARYASATEVLAALADVEAQAAAKAAASAVLPIGGTMREIAVAPTVFRATGPVAPLRPWVRPAIAAGLAAVAIMTIVAIASDDDEPAATPTPSTAAPLAVATPGAIAAPPPTPPPTPFAGLGSIIPLPRDPKPLADLDAMLIRGEHAAALVRVDAMLVENPDDAQLHVRRARALAVTPTRKADVLAAYRRALELDPTLVDDRDVMAGMHTLVREPSLRTAAAGLALASLGAKGLPLLVELVQAPAPLGYDLRHRAIAAIGADPTLIVSVDMSLQRSLDLWQAATTEAPCVRFGETLDVIEAEPTPGVLGTLHRVTPPVAPEGADATTRDACAALPAQLVVVRAAVLKAHPTPAKAWTVPPAYADVGKKKKKRGVFARMFGR